MDLDRDACSGRGKDALPVLNGVRREHDSTDVAHRRTRNRYSVGRHLLPAFPLALALRNRARLLAMGWRHPVLVCPLWTRTVSVPPNATAKSVDHRGCARVDA